MSRIVVVGGGVIGCAVAERLTRDRHQVVVLERDHIGAHASGAAAGLLAPLEVGSGPEGEEGRRSLAMFDELVPRLERGGMSVEFRRGESIRPALSASEERRLKTAPGRWVDGVEARRLEAGLQSRVRGALIAEEAQITPPRFVEALARAGVAAGAELREGTPVGQILTRGGRVHGVVTGDGTLEADWVVLAAGPWSPSLTSPLGVALDIRPSRGQLVTLRPRRVALGRMLSWQSSYLVPKPDGTVIAGSTEEEAGFDARPTAQGVAQLLTFAQTAVPELGGAVVERVWAALRPRTPDDRAVVGAIQELPGLLVASGHNRHGILLAPLTAERVAGLVS
ncbi:MAG: FAD-dependent oxidoreductase [Candidatus Dormibacteraeota bacterium]|nr:FAD-dependent oxidoreductase [Candidatus Dormibacteraeota bacterium]